MLTKLKRILNTYTEEELNNMDLWINSDDRIEQILISDFSIDLITEEAEVLINGFIDKERKKIYVENK